MCVSMCMCMSALTLSNFFFYNIFYNIQKHLSIKIQIRIQKTISLSNETFKGIYKRTKLVISDQFVRWVIISGNNFFSVPNSVWLIKIDILKFSIVEYSKNVLNQRIKKTGWRITSFIVFGWEYCSCCCLSGPNSFL